MPACWLQTEIGLSEEGGRAGEVWVWEWLVVGGDEVWVREWLIVGGEADEVCVRDWVIAEGDGGEAWVQASVSGGGSGGDTRVWAWQVVGGNAWVQAWQLAGGGPACRRLRTQLLTDSLPQLAVFLATVVTATALNAPG